MKVTTGRIVWERREFGHHFEVEKLVEPVQKGASTRHFRLWDNGCPALGHQWHWELDSAIARTDYVLAGDYGSRIRWLEQRVIDLERELAEVRNVSRNDSAAGFGPQSGQVDASAGHDPV